MTTRKEMPAVPIRRRQPTPWVQRVLIVLTLIVAADSLFGDRGFAARARIQRQLATSRAELGGMKNENAGLRVQVRRLKDDPDAIESIAREELGLVRPGELLVLIAR